MTKDARIRLLTAFDQLIQTYSVENITICKICQTAEVSRQSFYYYFDDIVDLFSTYIHEVLDQQINDCTDPINWSQGLNRVLTFIQKERIKFTHIYHSKFFFDFKNALENAAAVILRPAVETCAHRNRAVLCEEDAALVTRYYQYIFVEIILHYIDDESGTSPEDIVANCQKLMDWSLDNMIVRIAKSHVPNPANPR